MGTGNILTNRSSLDSFYNVKQNSLLRYTKELIVGQLRELFSKDVYFHYVADDYGNPKVTSQVDKLPEAGLHDSETTRIFIGEKNSYKAIYYPSLLVSISSVNSTPISFNRERGTVDWKPQVVIDGYTGQQKIFYIPQSLIFAGAWEGTMEIDIHTKDTGARDDLGDHLMLALVDEIFDMLKDSGFVIKSGSPSIGGFSEQEDRNDKIYKATVSVQFRSEWGRRIPITNVLEVLSFCIEFGDLSQEPPRIAPNLTAQMKINLVDSIMAL